MHAGMVVPGHALRAPIQPGHAEAVAADRPQRGEAVLARAGVIVDAGHLLPAHAAIARARQHRVVARRIAGIGLQPLHPQRPVRGGPQVRDIGPVGDQRLAHRDRARLALPTALAAPRGELQRIAPARLAAHPAQQQATARGQAQVRRGRARGRRQRPHLHAVIAIGDGDGRFGLPRAGGQQGHGEGEGDAGAHVHPRRIPLPPAQAARSRRWRSRCTSSSEIAAGVIPGMRCAWPTVCGRTRCSFCRASADRPCTCA